MLGYIQRGGSPTPFDRNLSTRMGGHATELIATEQFGRMITLKGDEISSAPLEEIAGKLKLVTEDNDLVVQGLPDGNLFRLIMMWAKAIRPYIRPFQDFLQAESFQDFLQSESPL